MDTTTTASVEKNAKPQRLRVRLPTGKKYAELRSLVDKYQLNTICTSALYQADEYHPCRDYFR